MSAPRARRDRAGWAIAGALIIGVYCASSFHRLADFPVVHEDEPWIAAVAYKLATQGIYGTDLLAGYYGLEHHYYASPPLYYLILAGVFAIGRLDLFQVRLLPVVFGLLVLVLLVCAGRQLRDLRVGIIAMMLLVFQGLSTARGGQTGIPLLDLVRIGRADIAVVFFGLSAFLFFNHLEATREAKKSYLWVGVLIGLATLTHLYGGFWLSALLVVMLFRRGWALFREPRAYFMSVGCVLPAIPWWLYVADDPYDWAHQATMHSDRYHFFTPSFYLGNVLAEYHRYDMDLFEPGAIHWQRAGAWGGIAGLLLAVLLARALRRREPKGLIESPVFAALVALFVNGALFALFLHSKSRFYVVETWSLGVLAIAWGLVELWDRDCRFLVRAAIVAAVALVLTEGALRIAQRAEAASKATPYAEYEARLHAIVPPGTAILGLQHYWIGLRDHPYRTWLLPFFWIEPESYQPVMELDEALERIRPDVILIDPYIDRTFAEMRRPSSPYYRAMAAYDGFMARHHARSLGAAEDPTYGRTEVFAIDY